MCSQNRIFTFVTSFIVVFEAIIVNFWTLFCGLFDDLNLLFDSFISFISFDKQNKNKNNLRKFI